MREFYVSMVSGRRIALLAGPFASDADARRYLKPARAMAQSLDAYAHFHSFGTMSREASGKPGVLNSRLGLHLADTEK